jgi:hypothetical protein
MLLIDYARAITPIRGRSYGNFCRAFDAEEGRSPLLFSICNTFWNISHWLQFDPYVLFLAMAAMFFHRRIFLKNQWKSAKIRLEPPFLAHLTKSQGELLPSLCVRRPSVVRPLTFYILIIFLRTTEHNLTKLGTQFSPFALIDYARAITPIRGRPYGDFCRAFDAEEGRSPLFFSIHGRHG